MNRRQILRGGVAAGVALVGLGPGAAPARQKKEKYGRLRAALHEMREARAEIKGSDAPSPADSKQRAIAALDDAIASVKRIVGVEDLERFKGVDRPAAYYKRWKDFPRLRAALQDLRESRGELESSPADAGGLREKAIDDVDVAIGAIVVMMRVRRE